MAGHTYSQRVGQLPLSSYKGDAVVTTPILKATTRRQGGLGMQDPSRVWEPGQQAAPPIW